MLQRLRETLALILIALLPFHAFLVTVGTRILVGPDHAPLSTLAIWKEALLAVILLAACLEILLAFQKRTADDMQRITKIDALDLLVCGLIILGIVVSVMQRPLDLGRFALGFKYDMVMLGAFVLLRRVAWSEWFMHTVLRAIVIVAMIVSAYGILTFILPQAFFHWLGYSDAHSLYIANKPLASFQQIGETSLRRIQSTFSGPNQMGLWLLLPWSVGLVSLFAQWKVDRGQKTEDRKKILSVIRYPLFVRWILFLLPIGIALLMTFSRSAWLGGFVITLTVIGLMLPKKLFLKLTGIFAALIVLVGIAATLLAPKVFFRLSSTRGHLEHPIAAWNRMWDHPWGEGLGTAGPASNRGTDTCVFLRPQDDPSWAKATPALCVFLGDKQVQPDLTVRSCNCPYLPENWYLQIGVELGVVGFVLFLMLTILVVMKLGKHTQRLSTAVLLAFLGISVACLLLHAWEDSAVAYAIWVLLAAALVHEKTRYL